MILLLVAVAGTGLIAAYSALGGSGSVEGAGPAPPDVSSTVELPPQPSSLEPDRQLHAFGDVPIGGGTVEAVFSVANTGPDPARIVAVYTTCMCTTATLRFPDGATEGPFGMPGHELPLTLDRELGAQESLDVTVRFDPAAHGPDATGPVERMVYIHTGDGGDMALLLTANVVKE